MPNTIGSTEEMVNSVKLDGCVTVLPPERIPEVGVRILQLGVPCVVKKPPGSSLPEAETEEFKRAPRQEDAPRPQRGCRPHR
jgi:hypothetical protein